jgi:sugar diacid utilization regulator
VGSENASVAWSPELAADHVGTSGSQLQAIVDEASRVLGRPMILTDRQRLLAYTQHGEGEVDRYRLMAIMKQPLPPEAFEWGRRHVPGSSEGPFRVPPNPALGYDARLVAPIRWQSHHLGDLSCTDPDQRMTDGDLERIGAFADEAAGVLYREMLLVHLDRSRERELLRDILSADEAIRREAASQLAELELFTPGGRVVVLVIPVDGADDSRSVETARADIEAALLRIRRHLAPKHGLHLVRPTHALILASLADPRIRARGLAAFAEHVHGEIAAALSNGDHQERRVVAAGGVARTLESAAASYRQALRVADVAATVSTFGEVVCWDDLGIYQMLTELPMDVLGPNALHPGLRTLLASPRTRELLPTLERYLDFAGDVQRTAASLYLHRTTLYHRLRRIERIAHVDLREGDDRLALHLSLKLARLQGVTWSADRDGEPGASRR